MDSQAEAAIDIDMAASQLIAPEEEAEHDEPEHDDEVDTEESDEQEEAEEPEQETESEEEETETFESIYEIAEALDMPVEDFLNSVKAKRKINGQEEEVPLSELIAGNQRDADYRQKTMELSEQKKQFDNFAQQRQYQLQQELQQTQAMSQMIESQLLENYNSVDWDLLERTDKEEWLFMRQKFQEDYAKVQQVKNTASQQIASQAQRQEQERQQQHQQYLAHQESLLLSSLPDWTNPDTRRQETKDIHEFLTSNYGFNANDVSQVTDHRVVRLVRDAMKAQAGKQQADIAAKKVKTLPKITKPGAKVRVDKRKKSLNQLSKTGRIEDALDLIMIND